MATLEPWPSAEWPWYTFTLAGRVPAAAFRPRPSVDGGLLVLTRRPSPLLPVGERGNYQKLVGDVFTGRGAGIGAILRRRVPGFAVQGWLRERRLAPDVLPGRLGVEDWIALHLAACGRK